MRRKIYRIRASVFYGIILFMTLLVLLAYFHNDLYDIWKRNFGLERITFSGIQSEIADQEACFLCGNDSRSMMEYYRKEGTLGIISLNNLYAIDFRIKEDEDGTGSGTASSWTNVDGISIKSEGTPSRGMASIDVVLPGGYDVDFEILKNHFCQFCLDKVLGALEYSKWKIENKNPIPVCLVDFETLDVYSLQNSVRNCSVRNYWVVVSHKRNEVVVDAYDLPYKE